MEQTEQKVHRASTAPLRGLEGNVVLSFPGEDLLFCLILTITAWGWEAGFREV